MFIKWQGENGQEHCPVDASCSALLMSYWQTSWGLCQSQKMVFSLNLQHSLHGVDTSFSEMIYTSEEVLSVISPLHGYLYLLKIFEAVEKFVRIGKYGSSLAISSMTHGWLHNLAPVYHSSFNLYHSPRDFSVSAS